MTIIVLPTPKRIDGYDDNFEPFPAEENNNLASAFRLDGSHRDFLESHRAEATAAAKVASKKAGLPKLSGTTKQKAWAETLRANYVSENPGSVELLTCDKIFSKAKFWIEQRKNKNMRAKMSEYSALRLALADAQIAFQARLDEMPQCRDVPISDPIFKLQGQVNSIVRKMDEVWTHVDYDDRRR